ncbi:TPA: hypothetical protein KDZ40_000297 [Vibrio parahaemolyticus]|nr:hypothetical protein [Vibrio parahaemolyticus]
MNRKLESLKKICNVLTNEMFYQELLDSILEKSNIRYTLKDPEFFSQVNRALFGIRYQSEPFRIGTFPAANRMYASNAIFFRSRKIELEKKDYVIEDFWEAPAEYTRRGRLNKDQECMLYVAVGNHETAVRESRVSDGDVYMLMIYTNTSQLEVAEIGWDYDDEVSSFISFHFSKNGDGVYDISEKLAKQVHQFENDGWCYPSVLHKSGVNICLNLSSKDKLSLVGALLMKREGEKDITLGMFDLSNQNKIRLFDDWNEQESRALEINQLLDKEICKLNQLHEISHSQQNTPVVPKIKAVMLQPE